MTEHEAFAKLTSALGEAASAANLIASLRRDQRQGWETITKLIDQVKDQVFDFAMRGNA